MKDIDFDELDQAVNQFLGNKKKDNFKSVEDMTEKDNLGDSKKVDFMERQEEKLEINPSREMIFAPRQVVSASSFHSGNYSKRVDFTPSLLKSAEIKVEEKLEEKNLEIHDNFDEKLHREHKNKGSGILDNFKEIKFEEPVLGDEDVIPVILSDEKIFPELKSKYESDISVDAFKKDILLKDKNEGDVLNTENDTKELESGYSKDEISLDNETIADILVQENSLKVEPIRDMSSRIYVPERPGVHQISTGDDIVIFGSDKKEEHQDKSTDDNAEKISVSLIDNNSREDDLTNKTIEVPQISSEVKNVSKISIQVEDVTEDKVNDENDKNPENNDNFENSQQTTILSKTSMEDIKTPFVQNPKIEKRPLGVSQLSQVSNFDIKPVDRVREVKRAKLENLPPETPLLSRDEYSSPVATQKKKSGVWTVVVIMLIMAICGVAGGFAIWYFVGQ